MEIKVVDRWDTLEKWVYIFQRDPSGIHLLRIVQDEQAPPEHRWINIPNNQMAELDPTIVLKNDWLEPLIAQLVNYKPDDDTVREAYLHERERVDKLIDYATQISITVE